MHNRKTATQFSEFSEIGKPAVIRNFGEAKDQHSNSEMTTRRILEHLRKKTLSNLIKITSRAIVPCLKIERYQSTKKPILYSSVIEEKHLMIKDHPCGATT